MDQTKLRQLQLVEKEMLMVIRNICDNHEIKYNICSGTLLGAVRHKGFIPWDDDIDINMPISDYKKFVSIAQDYLGKEYFVQNFMTDPNFQFAFTRIRKNNTTYVRPYNRNERMHQGVWIDIFPLVPINPGLELSFKKKLLSICNFIQIKESVEKHEEEFRQLLGAAGLFAVKVFSRIPLKIRQRIHSILLNFVFDANPNKRSHLGEVWGNITRIYPKEIFEGQSALLDFEGTKFKAPKEYHRYLEINYGDYMTLPPLEKRGGHGADMILDLENSYERYME